MGCKSRRIFEGIVSKFTALLFLVPLCESLEFPVIILLIKSFHSQMKAHSFIDQFEIFFSLLFFKCLFLSGASSVYFKHCFCRLVSFLQGLRFSKTIGSYIVCFTFNFLSISGTASSLKFLLDLMDIWLHYISLSLLCTNRCYRIMENRKSWWIGPWGLVDCVIITEHFCSSILVIIWSWMKMEKFWSNGQVWCWITHDEAYSVLTGQWTRMIHQYGQSVYSSLLKYTVK